jgi:hypothetical protein
MASLLARRSRFLVRLGGVVAVLAAAASAGSGARAATATPTAAFLDSLGINTTGPDRGQPLPRTIDMVRYCGFRWVRGGIEGVTEHGPTTVQTYVDLHRATGVRFDWGLVSGGTDVRKLIDTAHTLAGADALLAFEGNNEPNNWGVTYNGQKGGGANPSWRAVAELQRDVYRAVKSDPVLARYPVWSMSEVGAERDNVGLQFLTIPPGAGALMPPGTVYADAANCHNYIYHPGAPVPVDNKTWNVADPSAACHVDGLYGNFGHTWAKGFAGYPQRQLDALPRVTTETGAAVGGPVTERVQALNLLTLYLDQFARGWSHTAVYLLRDRTDEGGNQKYGLYRPDYTPRPAAAYLHNLTSILADVRPAPPAPATLDYALVDPPPTVHDLLLQRSDGAFQLIVWDERLSGSDRVTVRIGGPRPPTVTVYDPTTGVDAVRTEAHVTSIDLTLSDHPLVLLVVPGRG